VVTARLARAANGYRHCDRSRPEKGNRPRGARSARGAGGAHPAELEPVDSPAWFPKVARKDYTIGLNLTGYGTDDPDLTFYENFACGSENNYDGYCNPEIDKLFDQQSMQSDQDKRKKLVWEIERRLAEDVARPVLYHNRSGTCWHPYVKGYVPMINSIYNGNRLEDVWLDK